jgi:hypothetical protein
MIPTLTLLFLGAVSAAGIEGLDDFRVATSCSSTGTFTYTYTGHPAETGAEHHDRRPAPLDPTTITYTGCPLETHSSDGDHDDNDDGFANMSMEMDDLDIMFKPGLHTITRNDGPATTFTTTMVVSEASDDTYWASTVVQTIVVVTGTGGNAAAATGESASSGNGGSGNAASRLGDLAAIKAFGGVIAGGLLLLAFL